MSSQPKTYTFRKRVRNRLALVLLKSVAWLLQRLPRTIVYRLGRGLGWLAYYLHTEFREVSLANLDVGYRDTKTPAEKVRIARQSMQSGFATLLCLLWGPRLTKENLGRWADANEAELTNVRTLQARGKGVILTTMHYGDWELLGLATAFYGIPMTVVQEEMRDEQLGEFFTRLRAGSGNRLMPHRFAGVKLLKSLLRGEYIALLTDLNATPKGGGAWGNFFGLPVYNNTAAAGLSLRTGAPIVCTFAQPLGGGRFRMVYGSEISFRPTGNPEADVRDLSQKCLDHFEAVIREHPEHWLWSYKRWKFRPSENAPGYPDYAKYRPNL